MKKYLLIACTILSHCIFAQAQANDKIIVLLDWYENPNHAPLWVAEAQGYFKQQGLDVVLIGPTDPADPPKLVAAEKADIAITYPSQFLQQIDQGLPLVLLGTLIKQPLNCLLVLDNSDIHTPADLKGKRIGSNLSGTNSLFLNTLLQQSGLKASDVENINIHYDLSQALLSGKIDAANGMMRNFEPIQMALLGHPVRAFYPEQYGIPPYPELIYVVHKNHRNEAKLNRFLLALKKATLYLTKHPSDTWASFAKMHPEDNNELNKRAWIKTIPYFAADPAAFDQHAFLRYANFMAEHQAIRKVQALTTYTGQP